MAGSRLDFNYSILSLLILTLLVACILRWATHSRSPAAGEVLYWAEDGVRVYRVTAPECSIKSEGGEYFFSFWFDSSGQIETNQPDRNIPCMEVSIPFAFNPSHLITKNTTFQTVSHDQSGTNLTNISYSDSISHGDLVGGHVVVNHVSSTHVDATISGYNNADANARISIRALFLKTDGFSADAESLD